MRIVLILLAALPFLPALNVAPGADVASARVLVLVLFSVWFVRRTVRREPVIPTRPEVLLISGLVIFAGLSMLWAAEAAFAFRKAVYFFSLLPVVWMVSALSPAQTKKLLTATALGSVLSAGVGVAVFLLQFVVPAKRVVEAVMTTLGPWLFGASSAGAIEQFPSWYVAIGGESLLRAFLPFPNPHTAALFWGIGLALLLASRAADQQPTTNPSTQLRVNNQRWAARSNLKAPRGWTSTPPPSSLLWWRGVAIGVLIIALLATFSRGAYVMLAALTVAYGVWIIKHRLWGLRPLASRLRKAKISAGRYVALLAFLALLAVMLPLVVDRGITTLDPLEKSASGRLALWSDALAVAREAPLFGVGLGGYAAALNPLAVYRVPTNAHSTYLEILAELGIVGLVVLLAALVTAFLSAAKNGNGAIVLALTAFSVHAVFETNLYHPANLIALLLLIGVAGTTWKTIDAKGGPTSKFP